MKTVSTFLRQQLAVLAFLLTAASCFATAQSVTGPTAAQSTATAQLPAFDVASIRINTTETDGHHHIYNDPNVSLFRTVNLSVKYLIQFAYALPASQILAGPGWLDSVMFDVNAKSDASVDAKLHAMTSSQALQEKQLMVQALLADRFRLQAHQEVRQLPVFALIVANPKIGPKFQASQFSGTTIDTGRSRLHIAGSDDTISILSRELAQVLGRVVLNRTGLNGRYDLTLRWTPDDAASPPSNGTVDSNALPDIFTAIQEQLGLKLESTKGPVPVLVIDHIEHPTKN